MIDREEVERFIEGVASSTIKYIGATYGVVHPIDVSFHMRNATESAILKDRVRKGKNETSL